MSLEKLEADATNGARLLKEEPQLNMIHNE